MSQPAPSAKGTLGQTPFAHVLIYALDRRLTGSIVLEEPSHKKHALYVLEGAPLIARAASPVAPLGELTVESGKLDSGRLEVLLGESASSGRRLGEVLIERGVLDAKSLETLLKEQVLRRLAHFASLPHETAYGYYEATNFLERVGGPQEPAAPLSVIWRVLRSAGEDPRKRELLGRLGATSLRFAPDAPLALFGFDAREQAVVDVLRAKPQPLAELLGRGLAESPLVEQLVYAFAVLRHFELGGSARPVGVDRSSLRVPISRSPGPAPRSPAASSPSASPSPPASRSPAASSPSASPGPPASVLPSGAPARSTEAPGPRPRSTAPGLAHDPLRREIAERLANTKQSYYDVLGVHQGATSDAIGAAFFVLAKRFHPDRLGSDFDDIREGATRAFARMTEAHQILSDPERKRQYDELLAEGSGSADEQEQVQKVVRAVTSFQKAQVLMKRNSLAAAEEEARRALADDPEQADYMALVAWLEAMKPDADLQALVKVLDRAVAMEEANLRVRWYRGQLHKRLGKIRRAIEDFRFVADRDPRHVDAQREIRLYEMQRSSKGRTDPAGGVRPSDRARERSGSDPPAPGDKPGFFGKLFKR